MNGWQYFLLAALAAGFVLLMFYAALRKRRFRKERDFTRRLETLLHPKEEIKVICPGKPGRWILTNQRLILEAGEGFTAFPFAKIKKVSGEDDNGKTTVAAGKMAVLIVKTADQDFTLRRGDENFTELVKGLKAGVSRTKPKKKADKT